MKLKGPFNLSVCNRRKLKTSVTFKPKNWQMKSLYKPQNPPEKTLTIPPSWIDIPEFLHVARAAKGIADYLAGGFITRSHNKPIWIITVKLPTLVQSLRRDNKSNFHSFIHSFGLLFSLSFVLALYLSLLCNNGTLSLMSTSWYLYTLHRRICSLLAQMVNRNRKLKFGNL